MGEERAGGGERGMWKRGGVSHSHFSSQNAFKITPKDQYSWRALAHYFNIVNDFIILTKYITYVGGDVHDSF